MGFHIIDATLSIEDQQKQMRAIVTKELGRSLKNGVLRAPVILNGNFNGQHQTDHDPE
jgi:hypothetical protein